jgi:hypothetical protein
MNVGDMLVGRGDFFHAGDGYEEDNIRIHFYVDFMNWGFENDKTKRTVSVRKQGKVYIRKIPVIKADRLRRSFNVYHANSSKLTKKAKNLHRVSHLLKNRKTECV